MSGLGLLSPCHSTPMASTFSAQKVLGAIISLAKDDDQTTEDDDIDFRAYPPLCEPDERASRILEDISFLKREIVGVREDC
jgi:hypothetical protein